MFNQEKIPPPLSWEDLGNLETGRANLGLSVPVSVYRLLQYTMRDAIITRFDADTASLILVDAGRLAGIAFCKTQLDTTLPFNDFTAQLQTRLKEFKIGILRIEKIDMDKLEMVLTIAEDLDCSGLPVSDETVCEYDEGFIAGLLEGYTKRRFHAKEIDCWASGERVCRFNVKPEGEDDDAD